MITFGGVPLLIPTSEVQDFINRNLPLEESSMYGSLPVSTETRSQSNRHAIGLPAYNWPDCPAPKLNTLYWPSGASRWARGWFLCTGSAKDSIVALAHSAGGTAALDFAFGDEDQNVQTIPLYLLPPRPVSGIPPGATPTTAEAKEILWLLPVVDARYFWQFTSSGLLELTTSTTWSTLFSSLGTALGVTITADTVDADYLQPDWVELTRRYVPVPALLDAAAASVGQRITRDPEDGTVKSQSVSTAETALALNYLIPSASLAAGGDYSDSLGDLPEGIRINFRRWSQYAVYCDGEVYTTTALASATADPPTSTVGGKYKIIHSTLYAEYPAGTTPNSGSSPTNSAAIATLAAQVAGDYYAWAGKVFDLAYNGILDWSPTGFDDAIVWEFGRTVRTHVWSLPTGVGVDRQLSQSSSYEVLDEHVFAKLDGHLVRGGSATASVWTRDSSLAWADTTKNIVVLDEASFGPFATDDFIKAEWHCNHWTLIGDKSPVRFRLTATMSAGGSASANLLTFNGTTYDAGAATVYVFDWYSVATGVSTRGMFQGVSGMEGWAVRRETPSVGGQEQYDIVWMEQYAWDCEVTLTSNPTFSGTTYDSAWTATADVDKSFHQGVSPGSSITIYDDQNMYPFAKSGAKAKVIRTEYEGSAPYYKIVVCQQLALTARGTLSGASCQGDPVTITGFTVTSPSPFNLNAAAVSAKNPRYHAGIHGDDVWLALNKADASYEIVDIERHSIASLVTLRQNPNNQDWLQAGYRYHTTEICDTTITYSDVMLMRQFNWWCSGNYWCSGAGTGWVGSGSGSGSGSTPSGGSCDCTTMPSSGTLTLYSPGNCWHGLGGTMTRSGSTWTFSGTIAGDSWTVVWNCSISASGVGGTWTITPPACMLGEGSTSLGTNTSATNSCDPLHVESNALIYTGTVGCNACTDRSSGTEIIFVIKE